jgi:hypothetical protein
MGKFILTILFTVFVSGNVFSQSLIDNNKDISPEIIKLKIQKFIASYNEEVTNHPNKNISSIEIGTYL